MTESRESIASNNGTSVVCLSYCAWSFGAGELGNAEAVSVDAGQVVNLRFSSRDLMEIYISLDSEPARRNGLIDVRIQKAIRVHNTDDIACLVRYSL